MLIFLQMIDGPEDQSKFEQLYLTYRGLMYYVAESILRNVQDAEDAVHDAFVAVAKNISNISEPERAKTKAYLVTIVESKAIDLYRRKKKHPSVQLNEEIEGVRIEYEGDNNLAKCLAKLPARYRQFLLLKYAQGFDNRELAEQLDLSMDAIYKLDQRARAKLKVLCEEEGVL